MAESSPYPNLNPGGAAQSLVNGESRQSDPTPAHPLPNHNMLSGAQNTMTSIANSQTVQSTQNGPVADKARQEAAQTKSEFSNLASARQTPQSTTATGQNLTHYHSFFYNLLSWENPRATAISYAVIVAAIIATRYVPIAHYALRTTWMALGITAALEIVGKFALGQGFTSRVRPKKYWVIPRDKLEVALDDVEQLINFFVIESQRIVFAENVYMTIAAFASTLATYFLIKIMPTWGLALFATTVIYFLPLVYVSNKELIDGHLENAGKLASEQSQQIRDLASQHTSKAAEATSSAFKDYTSKAQEMIGSAKKSAVDSGYVSKDTADKVTPASTSTASNGTPASPNPVKSADFPSAPKAEIPSAPKAEIPSAPKAEPAVETQHHAVPVPAE